MCSKRLFVLWGVLILAFVNLPALAARQAGAYSQNNTANTINSSMTGRDFKVVDIVFDTYVALEIGNSEDGNIHLFEKENGEYKNAVQVRSTIENDSLKLRSTQSLSFEFPQDKLSAHKVINTSLKLLIPEGKNIIINVREATVLCEGSFKSIYVNQLSGTCKFKMIESNLTVVSVYADIEIEANQLKKEALTAGRSTLKFNYGDLSQYTVDLQTIHGRIKVKE